MIAPPICQSLPSDTADLDLWVLSGWICAEAAGSNLSNLSSTLNPLSGLLTDRGSRTLNTAVVQVQYLAGARSSLSLTVSYGLLRFNNSGFIGSRTGTSSLEYTHKLNARDYVGISYVFGVFRFPGSGTSFNTHIIQANYGRHVTGRLGLELGAGPQINVIKNPIEGSSTPLSWSAHTSLNYRARKGSLAANYYRITTNGGGILPGASTDTVSATWSTDLIRRWSFSSGPGYSHNRSLPQTAAANTQSTYNTEYMNASLSRMFGRYVSGYLTYTFQTQSSNFTPCLVGGCQVSLLRHVVGIGFDFHPRQITLD